MDNLALYNEVRSVPDTALKSIEGGRMKGMSDINPMYRIKTLTEQFGSCGIGWKYIITRQWAEEGANGEIAAFANIDLYIKQDGEWSEAIPGTGGSMFVAKEKNGPYTSDECYKMALTDAISVACKALGIGADVYWGKDKTKYDKRPAGQTVEIEKPQGNAPNDFWAQVDALGFVREYVLDKYPITKGDLPAPVAAGVLNSLRREKDHA